MDLWNELSEELKRLSMMTCMKGRAERIIFQESGLHIYCPCLRGMHTILALGCLDSILSDG